MNCREEIQQFWAALMFYTRIPVPSSYQYQEYNFHLSRKYFPFIGLIVGLIGSAVFLVAQVFLPVNLSVILSMLATVLTTGAFHEDGLADCCDGFGGGWTKEQVLSIMKDSRVGTYATVALLFTLAIKYLALYEIAQYSPLLFCLILICAHALSRIGSSFAVDQLSYVQDIDASKIKPITTRNLTVGQKIYSVALVMPACLMLLYYFPQASLISIPMLLVFLLGCHYFDKRIGGYTGDCLGALQQVLELIFYLSIVVIV